MPHIETKLNLFHFNARSIVRKWSEITAQRDSLNFKFDVCCICETWLSIDIVDRYCYHDYVNFSNCRDTLNEGGVLILCNPKLRSVKVAHKHALLSEAYNICAIKLHAAEPPVTVIAIYRAPWASVADTSNFFNELDKIVSKDVNIVLMGDFNMPGAETISTGISQCGNLKKLQAFMDNNLLTQINNMPSRKDNFLDLVFVCNWFAMSRISQQLTIRESDHFAQRVNLNVHLNANTLNDNSALRPDLISTIDYLQCSEILRTVNWSCAFHSCRDVDDFVSVFTFELDAAITKSTVLKTRTVRKRQCLPRYILKLTRKKNAE